MIGSHRYSHSEKPLKLIAEAIRDMIHDLNVSYISGGKYLNSPAISKIPILKDSIQQEKLHIGYNEFDLRITIVH